MKTVVEKIRTIVRLEYKFDDNYNDYNCNLPGVILDNWEEVMETLWQAYFGSIGEYGDVSEIIMAYKEEGNDPEEVVGKLLDYYADWVLDDEQYNKYAAI